MKNKLLIFIVIGLILIGSFFFYSVMNDDIRSDVKPYFVSVQEGIEIKDFYGSGDSMYPMLKNGDKVFIQRIPYIDLKSGMIVIYQKEQFIRVCHVLIRLEDDGWVTKGVNNSYEDSVLVKDSNYIGILTK